MLRAWRALTLVVLCATALPLTTSVFASAATRGADVFTVTTSRDGPGNVTTRANCAEPKHSCTLRAAVSAADALPRGTSVVIRIPQGHYQLSLGPLILSRNTIALSGASESDTVLDAFGHFAVVQVMKSVTARLDNLTLSGGNNLQRGGGIVNLGVTTLVDVTLSHNVSIGGGAAYNATGAYLHLLDSAVTDNHTLNGAANRSGGSAGGIWNAGTLSLSKSVVSNDAAGNGGPSISGSAGHGGNGGGLVNSGSVTVLQTQFSNDTAGNGGAGDGGLGGNGGSGGGIYATGGSITLTSCTVANDRAGAGGSASTPSNTGVAGNGGGIYNVGLLELVNSTVSSDGGGGGVAGTSGGGIYNSASTSIDGSTFSNDTAGPSAVGSAGNGGAIASFGSLTVMNSSFENNLAGSGPAESGVSGGDGGAVFVGSGGATVAADTFSANSAGDGGSAAVDAPNGALGGVGGSGGAIATLGSTTVLNDTITGNDAGSGGANSSPHTGSADDGVGGAVAVEGGSTSINYVTVASNQSGVAVTGGSATVTGTILSDNNTNCAGSITDLGYNLDNTDECNFVLASDLVDDSPALGALASNGGPTQTMLPSLSSPVIDAGATIANGCPTTDQRGDSRPDGGGTNPCDIGSVEQVVAP